MKRPSTRDRILLAQSGELGETETTELEHRLKADPEERAYRDDLDRLTTAMRREREETEATPSVLQRIHAEAGHALGERQGRRPRSAPSPWGLWRPALVYGAAATLLLMLGFSFLRDRGAERAQGPVSLPEEIVVWDEDAELDADIESLSEMLALVYDETAGNGLPAGEEDTLESIAAELLALEGLEI